MLTENRKDGIALIMVLGFLALLIISAVSFSVLMRTERLATRNYVDVIKARNLLHLSVARAMEDINIQITDGELRIAPPASVLISTETASPNRIDDLFIGEATNYVPHLLRADADAAAGNLPWIPIRDPETDDIIGRYAFIAVDSGGFLDANIISGTAPSYGADPREIRYDIVPEFPDEFPDTRRNQWVRFETLPELAMVATGDPENTFIYSRFPNMYLDENNVAQPRVYIGGDPADWDENAIKAVLEDFEPDIPDADAFFGVMQDYASASYVPLDGNLERINARLVPMINQVAVSNSLEWVYGGGIAPDQIRHRVHVVVETWYPFSVPTTEDFELYIEGVSATTVYNSPGGEVLSPIRAAVPISVDPNSYFVTGLVFQVSDVAVNDPLAFDGGNVWPPPAPGFAVQVEIEQIEIMHSQGVVDRVGPFRAAAPERSAFQFSSGAPFGMDLPEVVRTIAPDSAWVGWPSPPVWYEAVDPRINWDTSRAMAQWEWIPWDSGLPSTLGVRNSVLQREIDIGNIDEREVATSTREGLLHSNDRVGQGFRSLGELSFLLYDARKPWGTIRLLDNYDFPDPENPRRLFDVFTLHPTNRPATFGLVNPNTWQPQVMETVLQSARLEAYPNEAEDDPEALSLAATTQWVGEVLDMLDDPTILPGGSFRQRSDLTHYTPAQSLIGDNKFLDESPLRNSIDLFDTQQNIFTIILAAQATTDDAANPRVLAEQRAVAVIWRDPYPDEDGRHLAFVRYFRWLSE